MDLVKSAKYLTNNFNGYFLSEKQADLFKKIVEEQDGYIGDGNVGTRSYYQVFIEIDEVGITNLKHKVTKGWNVKFERENTHSKVMIDLGIKSIKSYRDRLKELSDLLNQTRSVYSGFGEKRPKTVDNMEDLLEEEMQEIRECKRKFWDFKL